MKPLANLLTYTVIVGGLTAGLASGVTWLIRSEPSSRAEARVAPIPAKIVESMERKKHVPLEIQVETTAAQPDPAKPKLQEAPVSLSLPAAPRSKVRKAGTPPKHKQGRAQKPPPVDAPLPAPPSPIATARSDFPY
jgi:hypothetical protein